MDVITSRLKRRIGNAALALWLAVGLWLGISAINTIPGIVGDSAGAFLPVMMIGLVVFLLLGRFGIEYLVNRLFPHANKDFVQTGTELHFSTGTSLVVQVAVIGAGAIIAGGPISVQPKQGSPTGADSNAYRLVQRSTDSDTSYSQKTVQTI